MKTLICDCNQTLPLDGPALRQALAKTPGASTAGLEQVHHLLCRREAGAFQRAAKDTAASGEPLLVACTQEQRLFLELNDQTQGSAPVAERPIRFVNLRETGGWSRDARLATPKLAALLAAAQLPAPEAVPTVGYRSAGRTLVIAAPGDAAAAERAAALLADRLTLTLLVDGGALPPQRERVVQAGRLTRLSGWLGAFEADWQQANPIDLDLCTRCNACIAACPEGAIDFSYQIDLDACRGHRACVQACDAAGAIDFNRAPVTQHERYDLVLDLRAEPAFTMHQPPQGYWHVAGAEPVALAQAVVELREAVGEFEKPKFFKYQPKLCAHSRNQQIGCSACIDVCSAQAIRSDASLKGKTQGKAPRTPGTPATPGQFNGQLGGIVVEPHLCVGCGACSTVCPSGALSYAYPSPVDQGKRLRTLLSAYGHAGGNDAALLLHSEGAGARLINELGRAAASQSGGGVGRRQAAAAGGSRLHGVPARVLPHALWHSASVGIDLWLTAIAQGASQVAILLTDEEAPDYRRALAEQAALAQAILTGLGYRGTHVHLIDARDAASLDAGLAALAAQPAQGVARSATFATQPDKRNTLELAVEHLMAQAPAAVPDAIALPAAGAPYGDVVVDANRCTLCLSCVGACPQGALLDNPERPQLRLIEKNCVQCGLCATTCPEDAITLQPRLLLADGGRARKAPRVVAEMAPYRCIRCSKPFGTQRAIENMIGKLAGHSAFQGVALERLKMCGDCRVIDLHTNPNEVRITDL